MKRQRSSKDREKIPGSLRSEYVRLLSAQLSVLKITCETLLKRRESPFFKCIRGVLLKQNAHITRSIGGLPTNAIDMGFTESHGKRVLFPAFDLKPGRVVGGGNLSPLRCVRLVLDTIFVQHLLTERNPVGDGDFAGVERTEGWLWKYFAVVIALGVVQYPEEKNAFRDGDSSEHPCEGLLGNSYIQRMMSFRQWQICKQHFSGLRDVMTDLVNAAALRLVVPTQCVTPMF